MIRGRSYFPVTSLQEEGARMVLVVQRVWCEGMFRNCCACQVMQRPLFPDIFPQWDELLWRRWGRTAVGLSYARLVHAAWKILAAAGLWIRQAWSESRLGRWLAGWPGPQGCCSLCWHHPSFSGPALQEVSPDYLQPCTPFTPQTPRPCIEALLICLIDFLLLG